MRAAWLLPAANDEDAIGKNVTMDMEPIACTATCDQRSIFQGKGEKHNSPNTQPYPADESEDDKGHVPRVAVYVDSDIPEYGEQSCSNDVNKQH